MAKVFVIDDSLSVCFAIERMLRARGMEVVSQRSGQAALESLEAENPDLVMCDLVLPDIEGFQICTFLQNHPTLSKVPVIVISGIVDEEVRAQAEEVGALAVLKKPFATEEMLQLVEDILQSEGDESEAPTGPVVVEAESPDLDLQAETPESGPEPAAPPSTSRQPAAPQPAAPQPAPPQPAAPGPAAPKTPRILMAPPPGNELLDRLERRLEPLASIEALRFACILSPNGELRGYGPAKPSTTDLAALPQLMRAASNTATHTRHGEVNILTLEASNGGVLVVKPQEEGHLMVLGLGDLSVLGKARYLLRRLET